jgi:hypothetical protein
LLNYYHHHLGLFLLVVVVAARARGHFFYLGLFLLDFGALRGRMSFCLEGGGREGGNHHFLEQLLRLIIIIFFSSPFFDGSTDVCAASVCLMTWAH